MRTAMWKLIFALLLPLCSSQLAAAQQDAASFVPESAAVFIEIHDLATLRKEWATDPLAKYLRDNLPMTPEPQGWLNVQKVMGMNGEEIVDRFFGKTVAFVAFDPTDDDPGMIITKVTDADAALAIEKLQLVPTKDLAGYRGFKSADDKAHIVIGKGWIIVTNPRYSDAVAKVLEGADAPLAKNDLHKAWLAKLPAGDRTATVYIRQADDNVHALGVYRKERDLTIQYRGKSPELAQLAAYLGNGGALDFGPLPTSTLAAISANILPPPGPGAQQLNRLFPGKSFTKDIHSKLATPTVFFLGEVAGDKLTPNPGLAIPVAGLSLKLRDPSVAEDLTKAIDGLMFVANFAAAKWEGPLVEVKAQSHSDITFQNANIGSALAHRAQREELRPLTISYGRVGEWYIICTQDQFFEQCIDAHLDSARSLTASSSFTNMNLKNHEAPIFTAMLKPRDLSAHMDTWQAHWKQVRPKVIEASQEILPATPEAQLVRGARIISGLLSHYQAMNIQAYRDGDTIAVQADVVRK